MYKKVIKYHDMDGIEVEETFRFHLSKAEILEMEISMGGIAERMERLLQKRDGETIINTFKELILRSYGEISEDHKGFVKDPELTKKFVSTEAYSELFTELVTNPDEAAAFFKGIVPAEVSEKFDEATTADNLPNLTVVN